MAHGLPALKRSVAETVVKAERSSLKLRKEATAAEKTLPEASTEDLPREQKQALLVAIVSALAELQKNTAEVVTSIRDVPVGVKAVFDECQQSTPATAGASPAKSEPEREPEGGRPATPETSTPLDRAPGAGRAALSEAEESLPSSLWYGPHSGWRGYSEPWAATLMATPPRSIFSDPAWEDFTRAMYADPEKRAAFMQGLQHTAPDLWLPAPPMTQLSETVGTEHDGSE
mmetsp:Transcript_6137/g.14710  ORF Transcript_6137/g.14710 Transcript_6137/m.14710 type:complete len:230 (-) Transcript_6137:106-795(-)